MCRNLVLYEDWMKSLMLMLENNHDHQHEEMCSMFVDVGNVDNVDDRRQLNRLSENNRRKTKLN